MRPPFDRWPMFGSMALAGALLAGVLANLTHDFLFHGRTSAASAKEDPPAGGESAAGSVTLPEGKLAAMALRLEPAARATLPVEVVVAGRIEATDQKVAIQSRVPGVVRSVAVTLGQVVRKGQLLVTLDSPDVGTARLGVRARQRELAIARTEAEWKSTVAANVEELVKELRQNREAGDLEKQFAGKPLGSRRSDLMATYADMEIAAHEASQKADLKNRNLIGEHPVALAQHTYEGARAKFLAMLEQVSYDAAYQRRLADQQVKQAEAAVVDAAQRLRVLGVAADAAEVSAAVASADRAGGNSPAAEDLAAYPIPAPFDGTITARSAVASQRVEPTDTLFQLVDLSTVRAVANVPESDFSALPDLTGASLRMTVASFPDRTFRAKVIYVAPEVDPTTRTVRLIAEIPNPDGGLKPGMFARIVLDSRRSEPVLTVPASSVVDLDGKSGVFVPGKDARTFLFRRVSPGREADGRRVVSSGLQPGDRVVTQGAFDLKSELILQNTVEED